MKSASKASALAGSLVILSACSGAGTSGTIPPPAPMIRGLGVFDQSSQNCAVSYDDVISYAVPSGNFSPIDVRSEQCSAASLTANPSPPIPAWGKPSGPTQAIFVATSLQQAYSVAGMQSIETAATASHVPVTWMIGNPTYLGNASLYNAFHAANGDDVELQPSIAPAAAQAVLPWYQPIVSAQGAGAERNIAAAQALGETGFWGITWDSIGIDGTYDRGAPWGTYCADPSSYKRPAPDGSCAMLAFEWTARDLTRGYLSGHTEFFSTDPDDLQQRAGFDAAAGSIYEGELVDAYAAAGQSAGMVMMSQQESNDNTNPGDETILAALYARAVADGMRVETLAQADADARAFSALPRAVAFPFIPGGTNVPSAQLGEGTLYPATIDFHDTQAGMTFLAGHTTPTRVFRYADDPISLFNQELAQLSVAQTPTLESAVVSGGALVLSIASPEALHYGVALWTNPATLGITGQNVFPAGRAGVVVTFNLQAGTNQITIPCAGCSSTTFPYAT